VGGLARAARNAILVEGFGFISKCLFLMTAVFF
jgi:hypothetical protein